MTEVDSTRVPDFEITLATVDQAETLGQMSRDYVELGLPWRWTPRAIAEKIRQKDTEVIVARDDERILGFAIMRFLEDEAHLLLLAVRPTARRAGVGRRMMEWLEKCAVTAGTWTIRLEVRVENRHAQDFYRALGYAVLGYRPGYYFNVEDALEMHRDLRASVPSRR